MTYTSLVEKQKRFFATNATRDLAFRRDALLKIQSILTKNETKFIEALKKDLGKPELEAFSTETAYLRGEVADALKNLKRWAKPKKISTPLVLQPAKSFIHSEPYGTTLIIAPWNYPLQLALSPLIGAIAAGNTVVLKPSEITVHTQKLLVDLLTESFPDEFIACIGGGLAESQALLEEKYDFIFFTGSTRVGRIVMQKAARHLTPVCLELGGKSPCIVEADIDIATAAKRIVWGKFMNAGQTCVAPDYLCINRKIADKFIIELKKTIAEFYSNEAIESSSLARIVNADHFERLEKLLKGSEVLSGGKTDRAKLRIEPTLIGNMQWTDSIMDEEIFGPLLPIMVYDNFDEILNEIRSRPKPLAFYLFTRNKTLQNQVAQTMPFGGACFNDCIIHLANSDLPFGGVGDSGIGGYHGRHSFECFSHKKSILNKSYALDAAMRYPPYTDGKLKLLKFFIG